MSPGVRALGSRANNPLLFGILVVLAVGLLFTGAVLTVGADSAEPAQDPVDISFEHTSGADLVPGAAQTYEVVVDAPTEGIEGYDIQIDIVGSNEAGAEIVGFDETAGDNLEFSNTTYNGTSIHLETALGENIFEGQSESLVIAEVYIQAPESHTVSGQDERLGWEVDVSHAEVAYFVDGDPPSLAQYEVNLPEDLSKELFLIDVNGNGDPATDRTGDALLEDVRGNLGVGVIDVQLLFAQRNAIDANNEWVRYFDFTESGGVGVIDVQRLFVERNERDV